jgi:hypothetical protein
MDSDGVPGLRESETPPIRESRSELLATVHPSLVSAVTRLARD